MNDSVHAWLDPEEVRRLAASLADHAPASGDPHRDEPGFGTGFVGFTHDEPAPLAAALPAPTVASPLPERLARVAAELSREASADGLFAVAPGGEVIFGASVHPEFHFGARALVDAPATTPARRARWRIGPDRHLELIPVQTRSGPVVLGIVVPHALPTVGLAALIRQLED